MRGGRLSILVFPLLLSACGGSPPPRAPDPVVTPVPPAGIVPTAARSVPETPEPVLPDPPPAVDPVPEVRFPASIESKAAKTGDTVPTAAERPAEAAPPDPGSVLRMQRALAASRPDDDEQQLRLAVLLAVSGELEEAERIVSGMRTRGNRMLPYLEFYLTRQLGDHREATKLLADFNAEERRATGFMIERAELCTKVRRYRDYERAERDEVLPGAAVLLYIEPRNFALQRDGDLHILHLEYRWELFDDRSRPVVVAAWEGARRSDREDRIAYAGPVEEFYQSFRLPLPRDLEAGVYRIKVTVTDASSGKSDRVYIPVTVTPSGEAR